MCPVTPADAETGEETIVEFVVRERLTKENIVELLGSYGDKKPGSRGDLAERLLGIRGLTPGHALGKLSNDDLKLVARRFGVPESAKPTTATGFFNSILTDEKTTLLKRLDEAAQKQRASRPRPPAGRATPAVAEPALPTPPYRPAVEEHAPAPPPPPKASDSSPPAHIPPPITPTPSSTAVGLPVFQETRDFVGAYKFAYQWDSEDLYEAELLGALRGRFGPNNAVRQQGDSGRIYDIVVRNAARVEVKLPKVKADLDRMNGQVQRYLAQHPGGVIVVVVGYLMKNQQEIHNANEALERAGAVVFLK